LPIGVKNDLMAARPGHPVIAKMTEFLKSLDKDLVFPTSPYSGVLVHGLPATSYTRGGTDTSKSLS